MGRGRDLLAISCGSFRLLSLSGFGRCLQPTRELPAPVLPCSAGASPDSFVPDLPFGAVHAAPVAGCSPAGAHQIERRSHRRLPVIPGIDDPYPRSRGNMGCLRLLNALLFGGQLPHWRMRCLAPCATLLRRRAPAASLIHHVHHTRIRPVCQEGNPFVGSPRKTKTIPLPGSFSSEGKPHRLPLAKVPPRGLEPPRPCEHRSSTCRVCQFRHGGKFRLHFTWLRD